MLVAGILLGIGVPNVMEFQRNGAMTAAANDFVTGVLMARTEAVKRQAFVAICLSDNPTAVNPTCAQDAVADSTRGFIVWVDENNNFDGFGELARIDVVEVVMRAASWPSVRGVRWVPSSGTIRPRFCRRSSVGRASAS